MIQIKTICIVGGGGLCHAIAPWIASQGYNVNILTNRPQMWTTDFEYILPDLTRHKTRLSKISDRPADVVTDADVIIVSVPGFINEAELKRIKPHLKPGTFVGGVFSSNGFFFDAIKTLGIEFPLWGFRRVPFICRAKEYGSVGNILGYKTEFHIAVENTDNNAKEQFRSWIENTFKQPTHLMSNYLEVALSNSNPILHPARIYTWLKDWHGQTLQSNQLFYEEWTDDASEIYIALDADLHSIIEALPIDNNCLPRVLDYYQQPDAHHLSLKIQSIESFKGIHMPVTPTDGGWLPDFSSRYFVEDFNCSLRKYVQLADAHHVAVPTMHKVLEWSEKLISRQ